MTLPQIHVNILKQFHKHVSAFVQSPSLRLVSKDKYFCTSTFMNESTLPCDEHDGIDLWRKYADIKRYVINQITPHYNKCLDKDGLIPSKKSKEEVLLKTHELLFKSGQDTAKTNSKNPRGYVMKDFTSDWYSSSS